MLPLNNLEMNWKAQHKISLSLTSGIGKKRLQEMSSVTENNRTSFARSATLEDTS